MNLHEGIVINLMVHLFAIATLSFLILLIYRSEESRTIRLLWCEVIFCFLLQQCALLLLLGGASK